MIKLKIKKGATVEVISGAEKGKRGTVLEIVKDKMMVRIQGVRMQTHYSAQDGMSKREGLLHYSNVKLIEAAASGPKKKAAKKASKSKSA
jgi:large subunit ribosomal protein L24